MPESARILRFPERSLHSEPSRSQATARVHEYLGTAVEARSTELRARLLENPEAMLCLVGILRETRDARPSEVFQEAAALYSWLSGISSFGTMDERDYFLGELALTSGSACRLLGKREQVDLWLDRADARFRHTINPGPSLAMTAYARLSNRYEMRQYDEVLELLPSLLSSFQKFGMKAEVAKCRLMGAVTLKESGRITDALLALQNLAKDADCRRDAAIFGVVLVNLGDLRSSQGDLSGALSNYREAHSVLADANRPFILAHLKSCIGTTLRDQGNVQSAIDAYRQAAADYLEIGMNTLAAYVRVLSAESLLLLGRAREAEFEIMAALPIIDQEKMLPEAKTALGLLQESLRQKALDKSSLGELRNHLKNS